MTFVKLRGEEYAALSARALGRLVTTETARAIRCSFLRAEATRGPER
jgi:hypothetical protein